MFEEEWAFVEDETFPAAPFSSMKTARCLKRTVFAFRSAHYLRPRSANVNWNMGEEATTFGSF